MFSTIRVGEAESYLFYAFKYIWIDAGINTVTNGFWYDNTTHEMSLSAKTERALTLWSRGHVYEVYSVIAILMQGSAFPCNQNRSSQTISQNIACRSTTHQANA